MISVPDRPAADISAPTWASIPWPIEAERESTTWISRSASIAAPIVADLRVPDRSPDTVTQTTAPAPASNAAR